MNRNTNLLQTYILFSITIDTEISSKNSLKKFNCKSTVSRFIKDKKHQILLYYLKKGSVK